MAQMDAMQRMTAPLMNLFGGFGGLDPFHRRGGWGWPSSSSARQTPFSWPSLRDPFFGGLLSSGDDWASDFFAHDERPHRGQGTVGGGGDEASKALGRSFDSMLSGASFHVHDKDDSFELEAHVPGYEPEDLHVEVQGDRLVLSGEHRFSSAEQDKAKATEGQEQQQPPTSTVQQYSYFRKSYTLPHELLESAGATGSPSSPVQAAFDPEAKLLRVNIAKPHVLQARRVKPPPPKIEVPLKIQSSSAEQQQQQQAELANANEPGAPPHRHTVPIDEPGAPPHRHTPSSPVHDELRH
jgi:HSP20 family molecular chaperone IbpA